MGILGIMPLIRLISRPLFPVYLKLCTICEEIGQV